MVTCIPLVLSIHRLYFTPSRIITKGFSFSYSRSYRYVYTGESDADINLDKQQKRQSDILNRPPQKILIVAY